MDNVCNCRLFSFPAKTKALAHEIPPATQATVNGAGSVSEISPRHSFLCKNIDVFIWEARLALGNRNENVPIWTLQPGDRDETF